MKQHCPISVVIPVYNSRPWIAATLDSVRAQTVTPAEIIVVDDGSTDGVAELIDSDYPEVRYIWQENAGAPVARNRGIAEARERYIAFLDADDLCHPERLERELEILEREPGIDVVGGGMIMFSDGQSPGKWPTATETWLSEVNLSTIMKKRGGLAVQTWLVRREVFERAGGYDDEFLVAQDLEMLLRLAATGHTLRRIEGLPMGAYRYREDSHSKNSKGRAKSLLLRVKALMRYGPGGDGAGEHLGETEFAHLMSQYITVSMLAGMSRGYWDEVLLLAHWTDKISAGRDGYRRMRLVAGFASQVRNPLMRKSVTGLFRVGGALWKQIWWPLRQLRQLRGSAKKHSA